MRRLLVMASLVACADGTSTLTVSVGSSPPLDGVDHLELHIQDVTHGREARPVRFPLPEAPTSIPPDRVLAVKFAADVRGTMNVTVDARDAADRLMVSGTRLSVVVAPSRSIAISVTLGQVTMEEPDLSVPPMDLAGPLHDLSVLPPDLPTVDMASGDLSHPDLYGSTRYVFLLTARGPILGTLTDLDNACQMEAVAGGLPDTPYGALVAYPPDDGPYEHIVLGQGRLIIKPDGTPVSNDADFFSASINHLAPIDQLADGTTVAAGCAYSNFGRTGTRISNPNGDCSGWTVDSNATSGTVADVTAVDSHWAFNAITTCDLLSCHVYCIQQ